MPRLSARGRRVAGVDFRGMMMQLFYTLVLIFQLSSCNDVHVLNIVEMQMSMYRTPLRTICFQCFGTVNADDQVKCRCMSLSMNCRYVSL